MCGVAADRACLFGTMHIPLEEPYHNVKKGETEWAAQCWWLLPRRGRKWWVVCVPPIVRVSSWTSKVNKVAEVWMRLFYIEVFETYFLYKFNNHIFFVYDVYIVKISTFKFLITLNRNTASKLKPHILLLFLFLFLSFLLKTWQGMLHMQCNLVWAKFLLLWLLIWRTSFFLAFSLSRRRTVCVYIYSDFCRLKERRI